MYIIFQPLDNEEVQKAVTSWLTQAGGSLPLKEIEQKCDDTFHFCYPQKYTEEEINKNPELQAWKQFTFVLLDEVVSLPSS